MKRLWILPLALLVACSKPAGSVKFSGSTPLRPQDKDTRSASVYCIGCGKKVDLGATKCRDSQCGATLTWADSYPCGFCSATGKCRACQLLNQGSSTCFNCRGEGFLTYEGTTVECTHCRGTKKCLICKGSGNCDACAGLKKLTKDQVSALVKKSETPAE